MTVNFGRCVMRLDEGDLTSDARAEVRTYKTKDRSPVALVHTGRDRGRIDRAVRYQDRRVFHRRRAELDLHVVRTRWRPVPGRDCQSVRAHFDAGIGRQEAKQQVAHRYERGVIRMSVETAIKPVAAGAALADRAPATVIRKAAVLGAGTMGSRIAAHLANAGLPVVLLDIPAEEGARSAIAAQALDALKKSKPAAFYDPAYAARVTRR